MSTTRRRPPVVLVADVADVGVAPGWTARDGFALPRTPWDLAGRRWMCVGRVRDVADMRAAVEALARGVGLVVSVEVTGPDLLDFLEDLHRAGDPDLGPARYLLDDDQRAVLGLIAEGSTVTAAAREAGMSARTAHRRLADARRRLGVDTTTAAVLHRDALSADGER